MIKAVVFDLDDTLYDYTFCHQRAMDALGQYCCTNFGMCKRDFEIRFEEAKCTVKKRLKETASSHNRLLYMQTFLEQLGRLPAEGALKMYDVYWDTLLGEAKLFPYVRDLLFELKKHRIKIGILTDLTVHIQHRKIIRLGLSGDIECLVTSEEVGIEKPSEPAFVRIVEKLDCKKEEVLMVGDSRKRDVDGAKKAGLHAIWFSKKDAFTMGNTVMEYVNGLV